MMWRLAVGCSPLLMTPLPDYLRKTNRLFVSEIDRSSTRRSGIADAMLACADHMPLTLMVTSGHEHAEIWRCWCLISFLRVCVDGYVVQSYNTRHGPVQHELSRLCQANSLPPPHAPRRGRSTRFRCWLCVTRGMDSQPRRDVNHLTSIRQQPHTCVLLTSWPLCPSPPQQLIT